MSNIYRDMFIDSYKEVIDDEINSLEENIDFWQNRVCTNKKKACLDEPLIKRRDILSKRREQIMNGELGDFGKDKNIEDINKGDFDRDNRMKDVLGSWLDVRESYLSSIRWRLDKAHRKLGKLDINDQTSQEILDEIDELKGEYARMIGLS